MLIYTPPLRELHFVLHELLDAKRVLTELPRYADIDADTLDSIAESAGRFATEQVLPLNETADTIGCKWTDGEVTTAPGFATAYKTYCELGWPSICADTEHGGQALPRLAFSMVSEMMAAASHAFVMFSSMNHFAASCLRHAANPQMQQEWLPELSSGRVLATMCMTEPQAGSDIGLVNTRAVADDDGGFRITGTKIFASGAEHDLTANIVHLVLARIPGAPAGSRGLSLFLVPKLLADGSRNPIFCDGIEHKMGLHGSPTCSLRFEGAQGQLIGEENFGLRAMFRMMNEARMLTGLQAVGLSEIALQNSLSYARERRQGRSPSGVQPCPLVDHPDVQRMLLIQKALTEGARALVHWTALTSDVAEWHPDADVRASNNDLVELLTPIVKGFLSENAQQSIGLALQIHGGHGYVSETGIEQLVRDIRITTIYEGTTGIQAQDLLLRKVLPDGGKRLDMLERKILAWLDGPGLKPELSEFARPLAEVLDLVRAVTLLLKTREQETSGASLSACADYLRLLGHLVFAFLWAQMAEASRSKIADNAWYDFKLTTARFYFSQMLPEAEQAARAISAEPIDLTRAFHQ